MNIESILQIPQDFIQTDFNQFSHAFNELYDNIEGRTSRENRLINLRFRLTLDLIVSIDTQFSETKTENVKQTYILLYKFLDLWNVYDACCSSGEKLGVCRKPNWDLDFLKDSRSYVCLANCVKEIKQCLTESFFYKYFCNYLEHFSDLDCIRNNNREKYAELKNKIAKSRTNIDIVNEDILFLMYMERNAFYHGGETARAGTDYSFRIKILSLYIQTLRVLIARLGAGLFKRELNNVNYSAGAEIK